MELIGNISDSFALKNYQLLEKIGEGGFGQVFKAKQLSTQQFVAIKFLSLSPSLSEEKKQQYIERFRREVDLISRLNHPNIVKLIDQGTHDDALLYIVFEFIEGQSLKDILAQGAMAPAQAADVMASVLDALAHAHAHGVIHRDIKPDNIMLYEAGAQHHVKVLDFGIGTLQQEARQLDYKSLTLTQETLGTPSYSAPEQLRGEAPIPQTDIYVWGLVFLECLSGKPTMSGNSLAAIFHQQLSPLDIPLGILAGHESSQLLRRVLSKKFSERPACTLTLYQDFKLLNFSNLVGEISHPDTSHVGDSDVTQINDITCVNTVETASENLLERKQISVLSIIVDVHHVDSEENQDFLDVLNADLMQQVIDTATRYGAFHVGNLGDTLLFYFGYPTVTDNDSRLCSRTALEVISRVRRKSALLKQSQGVECSVKMGIQVGVMVSFSNSIPQGKTAFDAMMLSRQAKSNQILCAENVKHLLDGYLHFEPYVFDAPNQKNNKPTFVLRGERQQEAFGFVRGMQKHSVYFGREAELSELHSLLSAPREETTTRLAHIEGEAGIGKSRLVFELRDRCKFMHQLVAQCLPERKNNALAPILTLLKFKFSLDAIPAEKIIPTLSQAAEQTALSADDVEQGLLILSAWLNLSLPQDNEVFSWSPEKQKSNLFAILSHLLCLPGDVVYQGKKVRRNLFIFEDLHWADPTSIAFISYIVSSGVFKQAGHCWLTTSRQPLPESLAGQSFTQFSLPKLSSIDTTSFVISLFEQQPVADQLLQLIIERSDGVPLFIEELVSSLKQQHAVHIVNGVFDFVDDNQRALVPLTLRDTLQQKLDQLLHGKDTVQLASAIGREFEFQLLRDMSAKDDADIQRDINALIDVGLIVNQRSTDDDRYIFKHALVRDAAYESIPIKSRAHTHELIFKALSERHLLGKQIHFTVESFNFSFESDAENVIPYDLLSFHAERAGKLERAATFLLYHAVKNLILSEYQLTENACLQVKNLCRDDHLNDTLLLFAEVILCHSLVAKSGYSDPTLKASYENALALCCDATSHKISAQINYGLFSYYASYGKFEDSLPYAKTLETLSVRHDDSQIALLSSKSIGLAKLLQGKLTEAESYLNHAVQLAETLGSDSMIVEYGGDFGGYSRAWLALLLTMKGELAKAQQCQDEASRVSYDHKRTLAFVLAFPFIEQYTATAEQAKQQAESLIELANNHQLFFFGLLGEFNLLWAKGILNKAQWEHERVDWMLAQFEGINLYSFLPRFYAMAAQVNIEAGRYQQALIQIDKGLLICKQQGHFYYSELYRLKAVVHYAQRKPISKVKRCLQAAKLIAEAQRASLWTNRIKETAQQLS